MGVIITLGLTRVAGSLPFASQDCWLFGVEVQALGQGGLKTAFLEACEEMTLVYL